MKNLLVLNIVSISLLMLQSGCKKDKVTYDSYFYTSNITNEAPLSLFIDNTYMGELPYLNNQPTCDSTELINQCLYLSLTSGKHTLTAKDKQGNIISESTYSVSTNSITGTQKVSNHGKTGGLDALQTDNCQIFNLFN